ncbi:TPA: hypothetical protein JBH64_13940, partial [Legionella pneumophila]|nr:hypothetical protein [Legionella pneumophila]
TIKHKLQNFCTEQQWTYVSLKSNLPCELIENGNITLAQNNLSTLKKNIRQYLPKLIPKTGYYWQRANSELNSFWTIHDTNNENLELLEILFSKYKVNLILVGEDGFGLNPSVYKAAHKKGIPMISIPYEFSTSKQIFESILRTPDYENLYGKQQFWNWISLLLFRKKWSRKIGGKRVLRTSGYLILAQEFFRYAPSLPWTVHGGHSRYLAAESDFMIEHYKGENIKASKIVLTGSLAFDDLYNQLKNNQNLHNAYLKTATITSNQICILSAFPGNYITDRKEFCEFKSYNDLVDYWISALKNLPNVKLLFQAHPAVTQEQRKYIESKGITLLTDDITKLITECDLLITSVSSVIRLAIVCKKPVINYDVYHFNYPDYLSAPGVIHVQDKEGFTLNINNIVSDPTKYQYYANQQAKSAAKWGNLDGQVKVRILKLIDDVIQKPKHI